MKHLYESPIMEVVNVENGDVVTMSCGGPGGTGGSDEWEIGLTEA